jgi:hypothetical protein
MTLLYGRTRRLSAQNGDLRPGQGGAGPLEFTAGASAGGLGIEARRRLHARAEDLGLDHKTATVGGRRVLRISQRPVKGTRGLAGVPSRTAPRLAWRDSAEPLALDRRGLGAVGAAEAAWLHAFCRRFYRGRPLLEGPT